MSLFQMLISSVLVYFMHGATHDSFIMVAIFSSLACRPTTRFFSKEAIPSARIRLLWRRLRITRGL